METNAFHYGLCVYRFDDSVYNPDQVFCSPHPLLVLKVEPTASSVPPCLPSFPSECVLEGSLGGAHRGTECNCQQGHLGLLIGYSRSQPSCDPKWRGVVQWLRATKTPHVDSPDPTPLFFFSRRAPFLMSHLFVFALRVDVSLSSAADVDVPAAGTVLSLFTFSPHKQGGEGRARAW